MTQQAIATVENDLALLSDEEEAVAWWLACSSVPGDENIVTILELSERLGVHRNTITAIAKRDHVREQARTLIKDFVQYDQIPRIMRNIWARAEKDPKLGLEVLKWLEKWGIDPLLGEKKVAQPTQAPRQTIIFNTPGGFEAAIRAMRGDDTGSD